jgi:four helix bundle protein
MAKYNVIQDKSFKFAIRIVNLYKFLCEERKEFVIAKQILRCGTAIGAIIEEGIGGQSDKDFLSKFNISYKEARETRYWLRLLLATDYISQEQANSMLNDIEELLKILTAIILTLKRKL